MDDTITPSRRAFIDTFAERFRTYFRQHTFVALLLLTAVAGSMFGATVAYQSSLTEEARQVRALVDYRPSVVTKVYASDGRTVIGEFAMERRIPISYNDIPSDMRNAILAIEDSRFSKHIGVDPLGIARAAVKNFAAGRTVEGGSTLTQQLTKILFLSPERTIERKVKEALIALEIERLYSKEQILELYCNQIFLGGGAYGVEAGARYYFSKSIKECSLEECALLAALPKGPGQFSPVLHPAAARARRDLVLRNMLEEGYIDRAKYTEATAKDIKLNVTTNANALSPNDSEFGYIVEDVRQQMEQKYGTRATQTDGLKIYTTIDAAAQREAVRAVRRGLHSYESRHGRTWRGNVTNVSADFKDLGRYWHHDWDDEPVPNEHIFGLVTHVSGDKATVRFGNYSATITAAECKLAGRAPGQVLKVGDLTPFKIQKIDKEKNTVTCDLAQVPAVAGALVAIDAKTGEIKAMVGGYDFALAKFNNATQAERQTGSVFKPFIYTAAMEHGFTPDSVVSGAPVSYAGWTPHNYDGSTSCGSMPLRQALAQSLNVPAVNTLKTIGVEAGADAVRRFGLPNPMKRVLPSALGATEEPLLSMVSAYSVFPNSGNRMEPHLIDRVENRDGVELESAKPMTHKVTSAYVAANMVDVMRGVVTSGTARAVTGNRELAKWPIAGKTGTVNDFTDAWFIGYTPSAVCGVWIGYPGSKKSLGEKETGGQAALPMWMDFMEDFLRGKAVEKFPPKPSADPETLAAQQKQQREQAIARQAAAASAASDTTADDVKGAGDKNQVQPVYVDIPPGIKEKQAKPDDSKKPEDDKKERKEEKKEKKRTDDEKRGKNG
jgi:penicillin-binding protein 1A